jgi:hypothetical protein
LSQIAIQYSRDRPFSAAAASDAVIKTRTRLRRGCTPYAVTLAARRPVLR